MTKRFSSLVLLSSIALLVPGCAQELVFVREDGGIRKIYRMAADGSSQHSVSPTGPATYSFPDISPDGQKMAYTDGQNVFISNLNDIGGSSQTLLSTGSGRKAWLRWSPDQQVIAYTAFSSANQASIWLAATTGVNSLQVTFPTGSQSDSGGHDFYLGVNNVQNLVYSRDGNLYSMFYNGTQPPTQITSPGPIANHTLPVISHDNKLLAYRVSYQLAPIGTLDGIQVVEVGPWSPRHAITMQSPPVKIGSISAIAFACDDQRLYVSAETTSGAGNVREIFSVRLDGSDQKQLTNNALFDSQPDALPQPC